MTPQKTKVFGHTIIFNSKKSEKEKITIFSRFYFDFSIAIVSSASMFEKTALRSFVLANFEKSFDF